MNSVVPNVEASTQVSRGAVDPEVRELLTDMLTKHAYREHLASRRFAKATSIAPSAELVDYVKEVAKEEVDHYRGCVKVAEYYGIDIVDAVRSRMERTPAGIPAFGHWLDVVLAHALNDYAGLLVLENLDGCVATKYAELAQEIVAEEAEHGEVGQRMLVEYYSECGLTPDERRRLLMVHLQAGIRCIGKAGSQRDAAAVRVGLKAAPASEVLERYRREVADLLEKLGEREVIDLVEW